MVTKAHTLGPEMINQLRDILWRMVLKHVCVPLLLLSLCSRKKLQLLKRTMLLLNVNLYSFLEVQVNLELLCESQCWINRPEA